MTKGYRDFEFDLPGALLEHLVKVLDSMEVAPLNTDALSSIPDGQGIYQLFLGNKLVYIGKTDAQAGLLQRLARHSRKILHRRNLIPEQLSFKAVRVFVFTAMDLETQLIKHYAGSVDGTPWNNSGFGSNDPGRNRDRTVIKGKNFDALFPIDIDRELEIDLAGEHFAGALCQVLKEHLPYTFRFESEGGRSRKPHEVLMKTKIVIPGCARTTRSVVTTITEQLPAGWQSTAFRSHIILYKESMDNYPDAVIMARS